MRRYDDTSSHRQYVARYGCRVITLVSGGTCHQLWAHISGGVVTVTSGDALNVVRVVVGRPDFCQVPANYPACAHRGGFGPVDQGALPWSVRARSGIVVGRQGMVQVKGHWQGSVGVLVADHTLGRRAVLQWVFASRSLCGAGNLG